MTCISSQFFQTKQHVSAIALCFTIMLAKCKPPYLQKTKPNWQAKVGQLRETRNIPHQQPSIASDCRAIVKNKELFMTSHTLEWWLQHRSCSSRSIPVTLRSHIRPKNCSNKWLSGLETTRLNSTCHCIGFGSFQHAEYWPETTFCCAHRASRTLHQIQYLYICRCASDED